MEGYKEKEPLLDKSRATVAVVGEEQESGEEPQPSTSKSAPTSPQQPLSAIRKDQKSRSTSSLGKPSLPSLHEVAEEPKNGKEVLGLEKKRNCPHCIAEAQQADTGSAATPLQMTFFGVRNYLHHFYEPASPVSPLPPDEDYHYLIRPKGRKCGAILFKFGLITGATLFLLGAVAIIIGYVIPKEMEIRGQTEEFKIVDRNAMRFNRNLDMCKLIGLAGFCSGGLVLVISLLAPTFSSSYWEDDPATEAFRVPVNSSQHHDDISEPRSPIPFTEKITGIQPVWTE